MNRASVLFTVALCTVLGVAACASAPAPPGPPLTGDALFFSLLAEHQEVTASEGTKRAAIGLALTACDALDVGLPYAAVVAEVPFDKYTEIHIDTITAGVHAYCPEFTAEIKE